MGKLDRFTLDCKNQADSKTESPCCNVSRRKSLCICAEKPETPRMPMMHWWCKAPCLCFWCPAPLTSGVPLMHSGRHYFHPGMVQQQQGMPWYPWVQCAMHYERHTRGDMQHCAPLACDWYATGVWGATSGLSLSTISGGTTQGGPGGRVDGDRQRR